MTKYEKRVQDKSRFAYFLGLAYRWYKNYEYEKIRDRARRKGAVVGNCVVMPKDIGNSLNQNFIIGNHCCIHNVEFSSYLHKVKVGNNVIIGDRVKIVRGSHNIDSPDWENVAKHEVLEIDDYVWLCPDCVIMPSVKKIGYGAVVGANAVVVKDVPPMAVVCGNPAVEIKKRKCVHDNLVVESLLSGDYYAYKEAWKKKNNI